MSSLLFFGDVESMGNRVKGFVERWRGLSGDIVKVCLLGVRCIGGGV